MPAMMAALRLTYPAQRPALPCHALGGPGCATGCPSASGLQPCCTAAAPAARMLSHPATSRVRSCCAVVGCDEPCHASLFRAHAGGVMSSEAAAADHDAFDLMPDEAFPAGAIRTPGPGETIAPERSHDLSAETNYTHLDQARTEGRTAAADPYGPNDSSTLVSHPPEQQQRPLYESTSSADRKESPAAEPAHPPLPDKDPRGTHLS